MTATDHETTVLDGLDFDLPCEQLECDRTAEWIVTVRGLPCCTAKVLGCTPCVEEGRRIYVQLTHAHRVICQAHGCHAPGDQCVFETEPLNPNRPSGGNR